MKFKLNINEPCHENWANMSPNEKGRFCSQCSKTVHDFTNHAPEEIAEVLKNGNGHVCGRIPNNMLNQEFTQAGYGNISALVLVGAAAFTQPVSMVDTFDGHINKNHIQTNVQNNYYKITGSVSDENGNPLGGAVVQILNGEKFIAQGFSLSTGNFALYLDKSKTFSGPLTIRIQKDGFNMSEETIIASQTPEWKHAFVLSPVVSLETFTYEVVEPRYEVMGDMAYETVEIQPIEPTINCVQHVTGGAVAYVEYLNEEIVPEEKQPEKNPIPKVVVTFEDNTLKAYPNPATDVITLELLKDRTYKITVFDLGGRLVQQHTLTGNRMQLHVSDWVPGNYIVYAVDDETHKSYSQKVVVIR